MAPSERIEAKMIEGTYDIAVDTPKYHRRGTLALKTDKTDIGARLTVGDLEPMEFFGTCADKEFDFVGERDLPSLGQVHFAAHGSAWGNSVDVKCQTDAGEVTIFGTRLSTSAGDFKSSHEYVMKASTGDFSSEDSTMYSGLYADGG